MHTHWSRHERWSHHGHWSHHGNDTYSTTWIWWWGSGLAATECCLHVRLTSNGLQCMRDTVCYSHIGHKFSHHKCNLHARIHTYTHICTHNTVSVRTSHQCINSTHSTCYNVKMNVQTSWTERGCVWLSRAGVWSGVKWSAARVFINKETLHTQD